MQRIFAHRGASGDAPENTLEAFALAASQGAHGVELDVRHSKDGMLVVTHDESVDRVSTGTGRVAELTLSELKRLSFGKLFPAYRDARIPTLEEVFALLSPTGLSVNVELKNSEADVPGLEEECLSLAAKMGMSGRVLYSSFNHHSMLRMKRLDSTASCGLLYSATMVRPWEYALSLGVDAIHPHLSELLVPGECEAAHSMGIRVHTWTVDDEAHLQMVLSAGADIVITNNPARALSVLRKMIRQPVS